MSPPLECANASACADTHLGEGIYRSFDFGSLARLHVLETRVLARDFQGVEGGASALADIVGHVPPERWAANATLRSRLDALAAEWRGVREAPERQMLGEPQLRWLRAQVAGAKAAGTRWQLFGQQIVLQRRQGPDLEAAAAASADLKDLLANLTADRAAATAVGCNTNAYAAGELGRPRPVQAEDRRGVRVLLAQSRYGLDPDFDGWGGYAQARERLLQAIARVADGRAVVYAGDSHAAWAGSLELMDGQTVGTEFAGTSVSASGWETVVPAVPRELLSGGFVAATPTMAYANTHDRGWMLVDLTSSTHDVQFMTVSSVASREGWKSECDAGFTVSADAPQEMKARACTASDTYVAGQGDGGALHTLAAAAAAAPSPEGGVELIGVGLLGVLVGAALGGLLASRGHCSSPWLRGKRLLGAPGEAGAPDTRQLVCLDGVPEQGSEPAIDS